MLKRSALCGAVVLLIATGCVGVAKATESSSADSKSHSKGRSPASPAKPLIRDDLLLFPEAEPDMGPAPLRVKFKGEVYDDDVVQPKFTWSFGDGSAESHERNPTHTYKEPGKYKVTLYVIDYWKRKGTDDLTIVVEEPGEDR
ncbi:MAG: PKD domain-containing protein [Deltaproteobacteria bacterium]|nr:PKD domain-containing protein [Deltaproteobacteria bacterium]